MRPGAPFRVAVFDFDDTLSLLRSGWQKVMISQALEILEPLCSEESREGLYQFISQYVDDLTGKPTIHQMERLSEEAVQRGGKFIDPELHKQAYIQRLGLIRDQRVGAIRNGDAPRSQMIVGGAVSLLRSLSEQQIELILCSGTDDDAVKSEMDLLDLTRFFEPHIYGAPATDPSFSKGRVFDEVIAKLKINGSEIVAFGDGVVEIRETRRVDGYAIGVAKWSADQPEEFDRHRRRLIDAGAQAIIPDYEALSDILQLLGLN